MAYVVTRPGATDQDFMECLSHLRGRNVDIGRAPRALDPLTGRRWLYAWQDHKAAVKFRDGVAREQRQPDWEVVEREAAGEGPLGPIPFDLGPRGRTLTFGLHPHATTILQAVHPEAVAALTDAEIRGNQWDVFRARRGGLDVLFLLIAPALTGITLEQLNQLGYVLISDETRKTVLSVPPADALQPAPVG